MFKKKNINSEIDYNDFKVVIGSTNSDKDNLKVHQVQTTLKSLESFSRSSDSLALTVTPLKSKNQSREKCKKKSRSATRSQIKDASKLKVEEPDYTVSRDQGESYMSGIMRNVNKESRKIIGDNEEERLRLMNIRLESKLSRLYVENDELTQNRTEIKSELETTKLNLTDTRTLMDSLEDDFESVKRDRDNDQRRINELEMSLSLKQSEIHSKTIDFEQITNDLAEYQDNLSQANVKIRSITEQLDDRNSVVVDLKKKISEIHTQLELTKLYQENSDYKADQLQMELEAMKNARKWFENQLKLVEEAKDKLQVEVHRITNCLLESNHDNEINLQKNKSLELKLTKFQEIKLYETTALLTELEQLQKEINTSDEEKRELEYRYENILKKYKEKICELEAKQEQNRYLNARTDELTLELENVKSQYQVALANINELEIEGNELRKKQSVLEDMFQQKSANFEQIEQEKEELENNLKELRTSSSKKDSEICTLNEDMNIFRMSFDRMVAERDQAFFGIEKLRNEISEVENQFEITRQNLVAKDRALKVIEDLHDEVKAKLSDGINEISLKDEAIASLKFEKTQLLESCEQFQQNNIQILKELDMLRGNLNLANITIAGLEDQLSGMKNENIGINKMISYSKIEMDKIKVDLTIAQEKVESLSSFQEKYLKLFEDHKQLEESYGELCEQHKMLTNKYQQITEEMTIKLEEKKKELIKVLSSKEEMVQNVQRDLLMADQSNKDLRNELENTRFHHTVEIATKEDQFREQLDKSSKQFSDMCQEKIRCETAIGSLQDHIKLLVDEYNKKLVDYKSKMLNLQQQSTAYAEFENRTRLSLEELEQKKGEIEAIMHIWKKMKEHAEILENALALRDAQTQHLINVHDDSLAKKDMEIEDLKTKLNIQCDRSKTEEGIKNNFMYQLEERVTVIDQLRKKVDRYEIDYDTMQRDFSLLKTDYQTLYQENFLFKESQHKLTNEIENKTIENRKLLQRNQSLMENIDQAIASRDNERRKTISLQKKLDQKSNEVKIKDVKHEDVVKSGSKAIEEMAGLVKDVTTQNDSLIRKVELSNQQDLIMSAILNQLRSEVKKIIFQQEIERDMPNSIHVSGSQLEQLKNLLAETREPKLYVTPQPRLTKCIEDLKTQINSLQCEISKQLEDQMYLGSMKAFNSNEHLD